MIILGKRKQEDVQTGKKAYKIAGSEDQLEQKVFMDAPDEESNVTGKDYHNAIEKKRREKMNTYLQEIRVHLNEELETCVKNDKLSILKSAHQYLLSMRGMPNVSTNKAAPSFLCQEELSHIIANMNNGFIMLTDAKEGTIVWNFNLELHLGYDKGELLGTSIFSLLKSKDLATFKQCITPNISGSLLETKKRSFIVNLLKKPRPKNPAMQINPLGSNEYISILISGELYDIKTSALMGDRAESSGLEEHISCFIAIGQGLSPEILYATQGLRCNVKVLSREGPDGKIEHIHDSIFYLLGYTPVELNDHTLFELIHPHDSKRLYSSFFEASNSRSYTNSVVVRLKQKCGMYQTVEIKKLAVRHPSQDVVVSFISCMTETVIAEENWEIMFPPEEVIPEQVYDPIVMMRQQTFMPQMRPADIGMDPSRIPSYPHVLQPNDFEGELATLFDVPIYLKDAVEKYEYAQGFVEKPFDGVANNNIQTTYDSLLTNFVDVLTDQPF